jgi:hypothetical protein
MERNEWELIGMRKFLGFPFCELGKKNIKKGNWFFSLVVLVGMSVSESKDAVRREKNP